MRPKMTVRIFGLLRINRVNLGLVPAVLAAIFHWTDILRMPSGFTNDKHNNSCLVEREITKTLSVTPKKTPLLGVIPDLPKSPGSHANGSGIFEAKTATIVSAAILALGSLGD